MNTERVQVGWRFWLWWFMASTVGIAVGLAVGFSAGLAVGLDSPVGLAVGFAVFGAALGIAQWVVLRREFSRVGWWVLASTVGLAVSGALILSALKDLPMGIGTGSVNVVGLVLGLAVYAAITGGVMVWMMRQPSREA